MPEQVQCPNCGGYKVVEKEESIRVSRPLDWGSRVRGTILLFIVASSCGIWAFPRGETFLLILAFIGIVVGVLNLTPLFATGQKVIGAFWHYTCLLCGYKWDWYPGTPKPEVHVRPDLIAKGEQRLKEDQEEEKRRREEEYRHAGMWMNKKD